MTGTLYCKKHRLSDETLNRGPDSLWSLKITMALLVKSRGVTPVSWPNSLHYQSWPPNNPHPLDWLYDSLSSPPVAGVWWAHWRRCAVAAVVIQVDAAHWWWLRREPPPHMIVKRFGFTTIHNKALYKCFIHSFIHSFILMCCRSDARAARKLQFEWIQWTWISVLKSAWTKRLSNSV